MYMYMDPLLKCSAWSLMEPLTIFQNSSVTAFTMFLLESWASRSIPFLKQRQHTVLTRWCMYRYTCDCIHPTFLAEGLRMVSQNSTSYIAIIGQNIELAVVLMHVYVSVFLSLVLSYTCMCRLPQPNHYILYTAPLWPQKYPSQY